MNKKLNRKIKSKLRTFNSRTLLGTKVDISNFYRYYTFPNSAVTRKNKNYLFKPNKGKDTNNLII